MNKELERRKKISIALKGNKNGLGKRKESTKENISKGRKSRKQKLGYINSPETRKKMSESRKGKIPWNKNLKGWMSKKGRESISAKNKIRLANPENHYNWKGGKSFEPYPTRFTKQLKEKIKGRDNHTCQLCGVEEKDYFQKLSIHHIDYNKENCKDDNLITLCRGCNAIVNYGREDWEKLFKEKVQRL